MNKIMQKKKNPVIYVLLYVNGRFTALSNACFTML